MNATLPTPATTSAATSASPIPMDRVNELYRGEIFTEESARIARDRVHWMCAQCDGDSVLDVGCSQGITAILLAREGLQVTAIDTHPESVAFARNEFARETPLVQRRLTLLETDLASLPDEAAYDSIVLGEVLEHQALPERFLRRAASLVKPGGKLIVTTPFALYPHPDHKISVLPRHLIEMAAAIGLQVVHLDVLDPYIRCVLVRPLSGTTPRASDIDLLRLTERATLKSQQRLFDQIGERSDQVRKRSDALKAAQRKITEAAAAADALAREHQQALRALRSASEHDLQAARQSFAASESARVELEKSLHALRSQHDAELRALRTALEQELRLATESVLASEANCQTLDERLVAMVAELASARDALADIEARHQALAAAPVVPPGVEAELERTRKRLSASESARKSVAIELAALQRRDAALIVEHSTLKARFANERQRLRQQLVDLRAASAAIRHRSSYRLGRALIRSTKTFGEFVALPGELWSIARDAMARRRSRSGGNPAPEAAKPVEEIVVPTRKQNVALAQSDELDVAALVALFEAKGMGPLVAHLKALASRLGKRIVAIRMLQLGKELAGRKHVEAEFELAQAALELDRSDAILRGYFWVAQRTRRFEQACEAIRSLETLYGAQPSKAERATLDKLRVSPAYQLTVLSQVVGTPVERIDSVARRICYVLHNSLPYSSGGYGTRSHGVATGLKANGFDVVVLTRPGFPLDIKDDLSADQVLLEDEVDGIRYLRTLAPIRRGMSLVQYVTQAARAMEARFREQRPSLVMAASNHVTALPALIAARRLGIPFIYEVRGLWEITRLSRDVAFEDSPAFAVQKLLESRVSQLADHVFTLTEPMREELIERGVVPAKIDLLPNSCDAERFLPRSRDEALAQRLGIPAGVPVIGYVGTFVDYEGLEDLAAACGLLKQRGVDFRLLMVGNENASAQGRGPITEQIDLIAVKEGFSAWLIMPGRVPHDEVESYYSLIDIAPFPRKPWPVCEMVSPMKPLEALAMEKAVLVSSVRALTEMIADGQTGRVFEKGSIDSLAQRLQELIDAPQLRARLGRQGREWVRAERTWNRVIQRFEPHYESVVSRRP